MNKGWQATIALAAAIAGAHAHAGEVYAGIGTHGATIGYAQPVSPSLTLRGDYATLGSRSRTKNEDGIDYDARVKFNRTGLFADWFVSGGWRLTGGVTFNNVKADLSGRGSGGTIDIGDSVYTFTQNDRFDVRIKYPRTTPFLGLGYGHHAVDETGFGFTFDLGASIGRAKLTASATGPSFDSMTPEDRARLQADIDQELGELRDGVGKVRLLPLLSIGLNYRF